MSVFKMFATDSASEVEGVKFNYDDDYFVLARAGGKNTAFVNLLRQRLSALENVGGARSLSPAISRKREEVTVDTFIETCLRSWGSGAYGPGRLNPAEEGGEPIEFSKAAAKQLFEMLPDLLADLINCAQGMAAYRRDITETDAKN